MTIQERLDDAETQYHLLLTGQMARVYVDQNGERVEYTSVTASRLASYIESLKVLLGSSTATNGSMVGYF